MRRADIEKKPELEILMESDEMGVCFVHEKAGNRLYVFNHVEYDSTSLSDEYFRDVDAGVPIKMPHNHFPHNDPTLTPQNRWRSHAHLLFGNWINDIYQTTSYDLADIGKDETLTATLTIRPIEASDEQDWRRLWKAYLAFYETTLPDDIYTLTFSRLLSGAAHEYAGFLAVLDGKPVGLAHYLFHRSCWHTNSICYLQDLFADPDVRGQGIGSGADRGRLCPGKRGKSRRGLLDDPGLQRQCPQAV